MKLFTIGISGWNEGDFFKTLTEHDVGRVLDIRRRSSSRGSHHAFGNKLRLSTRLLELGIEYSQVKELAPAESLWKEWYKRKRAGISPDKIWPEYKSRFLAQSETKGSIANTQMSDFQVPTCLLCACNPPEYCHRTIVAEMLKRRWNRLEILHL